MQETNYPLNRAITCAWFLGQKYEQLNKTKNIDKCLINKAITDCIQEFQASHTEIETKYARELETMLFNFLDDCKNDKELNEILSLQKIKGNKNV